MSITLCYLCARQFLLNIIYLSKFNDTKKKKKKHKHKNDDITRTLQNACRTHIHVYTKRQKKKRRTHIVKRTTTKKLKKKNQCDDPNDEKKNLVDCCFFHFKYNIRNDVQWKKKTQFRTDETKIIAKHNAIWRMKRKKIAIQPFWFRLFVFFFKRNRIRTCFMSIFIPWTNAVIIDIYGILNEKLYK